jgi:ParB-like chromosome segregation protein Spo0J
MRNKIVLVDIKKLKSHEETDPTNLKEVIHRIKKDGYLKNPVVVEDKHNIILDGHHRVAALKKLGVKFVPSFLISYDKVRVFLRRNLNVSDIKREVIKRGISKNLFPSKTTRHLIKDRPRNINITLNSLI